MKTIQFRINKANYAEVIIIENVFCIQHRNITQTMHTARKLTLQHEVKARQNGSLLFSTYFTLISNLKRDSTAILDYLHSINRHNDTSRQKEIKSKIFCSSQLYIRGNFLWLY